MLFRPLAEGEAIRLLYQHKESALILTDVCCILDVADLFSNRPRKITFVYTIKFPSIY